MKKERIWHCTFVFLAVCLFFFSLTLLASHSCSIFFWFVSDLKSVAMRSLNLCQKLRFWQRSCWCQSSKLCQWLCQLLNLCQWLCFLITSYMNQLWDQIMLNSMVTKCLSQFEPFTRCDLFVFCVTLLNKCSRNLSWWQSLLPVYCLKWAWLCNAVILYVWSGKPNWNRLFDAVITSVWSSNSSPVINLILVPQWTALFFFCFLLMNRASQKCWKVLLECKRY